MEWYVDDGFDLWHTYHGLYDSYASMHYVKLIWMRFIAYLLVRLYVHYLQSSFFITHLEIEVFPTSSNHFLYVS